MLQHLFARLCFAPLSLDLIPVYGTFAQRISHCSALNGERTNMYKGNLMGVVYS